MYNRKTWKKWWKKYRKVIFKNKLSCEKKSRKSLSKKFKIHVFSFYKEIEGRKNFYVHFIRLFFFTGISHSIWGFISQTEFEMSLWIKISNEIFSLEKIVAQSLKGKSLWENLFLWIKTFRNCFIGFVFSENIEIFKE